MLKRQIRRSIPTSQYIAASLMNSLDIRNESFFPLGIKDNNLKKLFNREKSFSVSDLKTQYCELRTFYDLILSEPSQETSAMTTGSDVHRDLELSVNIGKRTDIPQEVIITDEDKWAAKMIQAKEGLDQLIQLGQAREIYVFGLLSGRFVTGYIDLLTLTPQSRIKITDTKFRMAANLPPESVQNSAYHQLLMYHRLLDQMIRSPAKVLEGMIGHLQLNTCTTLNPNLIDVLSTYDNIQTLQDVAETFTVTLNSLPLASNKLQVEYVRKRKRDDYSYTLATVDYDYNEDVLNELLNYSYSLWEGERPPLGVSVEELFKCKYCPMAEKCQWKEIVEDYTSNG